MALVIPDKIFKNKVDGKKQQAKDVVTKGPSLCQCPRYEDCPKSHVAIYHCQVKQHIAQAAKELRDDLSEQTSSESSLEVIKIDRNFDDIEEENEYKPERDINPSLQKYFPTKISNISNIHKQKLKKAIDKSKLVKPSSISPKPTRRRDFSVRHDNIDDKNSQQNTPPRRGRQRMLAQPSVMQDFWKRTQKDVSVLREQLESLKKETVKIEDLKNVEMQIAKSVQRTVDPDGKDFPKKNIPGKIETKKRPSVKKTVNNNYEPKTEIAETVISDDVDHCKTEYAVCFCGMHRDVRNKSKAANDVVDQESSSTIQKPPLDEKKPSSENITPQPLLSPPPEKKPTCGSTCACFNKLPSNSSIDKLLATLHRWKTDLNDLSVTDVATGKLGYDALISMSKKDMPYSASHKMYDSSRLICFSDLTNLNTIKDKTSSGETYQPEMNKDSTREIPISDSVYIAAVNLEKSNSNFYKNIISSGNTVSFENNLENLINCANSCKCPVESLRKNTETNKIEEKGTTIISATTNEQREDLNIKNVISKMICEKDIPNKQKCNAILLSADFVPQKEHAVDNLNKGLMTQDSLPNTMVPRKPCTCDQQIKLLGVTLTNHKSNKKQEFTENDKTKSQLQDQLLKVDNLSALRDNNLFNTETSQTFLTPYKNKRKEASTGGKEVSKGGRVFDTNSLISNIEGASHEEKCVCCMEVKDLEFNTFHLIEEHLKEKLAGLKTGCKCSCFKPNEERKAFSELVKKIQNIISDVTCNIECKCSENISAQDSWLRALNLLKEYLKIKINRVECVCSSTQNTDKESILPDIIEKISQQIEKDFQRLKTICKCKNVKNHMGFSKSEKEIENDYNKLDILQKYIFTTFNSSAQVSPDSNARSAQIVPSLDNKSCEAKNNENSKTIQTQDSLTKKCTLKTATLSCNLLNSTLPIVTQSTQYSDKNLSNDSKEHSNLGNSDISQLPLIGATLNCSSKNEINCICPKSKIREMSAKIGEILKTHLDRQSNYNVSYIMNSANKLKDITNAEVVFSNQLHEIGENEQELLGTTAINTNSNIMEVLKLKDSVENIKKFRQNNETNTLLNSGAPSKSSYYSSNEDSQSYYPNIDTQTQLQSEITKKKFVRFPENEPLHEAQTETNIENVEKISSETKCKCDTVPICHVKMLVNSIESKLINAECTCDALSSSVCPVHSSVEMG